MQHILEYNKFEQPQKDFITACVNGIVDEVEILLRHPYVNPRKDRNLGLQCAIANGHSKVVKLLLADERTDPTDSYHNFLQEASFLGDHESVKALMETGLFNPSDTSNYALKVANANDNHEVIKVLLEDERVINNLFIIEFDSMKDFLKSELMTKFGLNSDEELKGMIQMIR